MLLLAAATRLDVFRINKLKIHCTNFISNLTTNYRNIYIYGLQQLY